MWIRFCQSARESEASTSDSAGLERLAQASNVCMVERKPTPRGLGKSD